MPVKVTSRARFHFDPFTLQPRTRVVSLHLCLFLHTTLRVAELDGKFENNKLQVTLRRHNRVERRTILSMKHPNDNVVNNTNYNYQNPSSFIDPAVLNALMNGAVGGGFAAWGGDESASQVILNNGYTEVPQQELIGDTQCWDRANFGTLDENPSSQLVGQAGFQQPSISTQEVARANNLAFPFGSLPPVPPPNYNNYEGRHNLKAPWEYGDHTTRGEFEESTIVPSRSNTHTRVPSGGLNSNTGTSSTLVELRPVNGDAPSKVGNEKSQKDAKKDKGKARAVAFMPTPPFNVEEWVGAVDTTIQVSPNQSATPPHECLAAGDFNDVDRSALVVTGLTIPEDSALYRRRAVGAEFVPPPFDMNGASGMRPLPPVHAPDAVQTHPATTSTAPEPSAFARHPRPTDPSPSSSPNAIAKVGPSSSSRTPQAAGPSSKKRKAADSGTGAPAKKQSHHDKMQSRQDKKQSRPRRPKDPKTSAKKHKHAEAGHEYFTLTHSNWILRLPAEDENAAQAGSSDTDSDAPSGKSSSDEAQVSDATTSNDASANAGNDGGDVESEDPVTTHQHAAWHDKQERPIEEQAPFGFGRESDLRRRAIYGPDTLARIERENAATATSSSNASPNGSATPDALSSSSPPLDVGPRGHGGRRHGDVTIRDRAPASDNHDRSNEVASAGPALAIGPDPISSSMPYRSQAMQLPQEEKQSALPPQSCGSIQTPHTVASLQPPHAYQQYAPPHYAPARWYAPSCDMPRQYDTAPNPYMMPTTYSGMSPFSWQYFPPAELYAPSLYPSMSGDVQHYADYEQSHFLASYQTHSYEIAPPSNDALYRHNLNERYYQ